MKTSTSTLIKKVCRTHYTVVKDGVQIGKIDHHHSVESNTHKWLAYPETGYWPTEFTTHKTRAAAWDAIDNA